jgi:hypothetical protein
MHWQARGQTPMIYYRAKIVEAEPDVNVVGGWECSECDVFVPQWETDDDDL